MTRHALSKAVQKQKQRRALNEKVAKAVQAYKQEHARPEGQRRHGSRYFEEKYGSVSRPNTSQL